MTPVEFRRRLHAHPELSFREDGTAAFIAEQLAELGIEHRTIARTGILARIPGRRTTPGDRRAVVLRADIDALPIAERTGLAYSSRNAGVMHACGHDVHAAVLFGVLQRLAADPDFGGTLLGLFQPGEECNPGGASLVLAEDPFGEYDIRAVIGEHVEPQLEVGTLGFRAGKYMAASDELRLRVRGTGGHGALRSQLRDPVAAGAELADAPASRSTARSACFRWAACRPTGRRTSCPTSCTWRARCAPSTNASAKSSTVVSPTSPRTSTNATACAPTSGSAAAIRAW